MTASGAELPRPALGSFTSCRTSNVNPLNLIFPLKEKLTSFQGHFTDEEGHSDDRYREAERLAQGTQWVTARLDPNLWCRAHCSGRVGQHCGGDGPSRQASGPCLLGSVCQEAPAPPQARPSRPGRVFSVQPWRGEDRRLVPQPCCQLRAA